MYDIIYIGGGLNYAGAVVAAKSGKKVALIEKDLDQLGGTCLHKGCIPSKMFLHYANLVYESHNDILEGELKLSQKRLFQKKDELLKSVTKVVQKQCSHFDLIEGEAKIVAAHKVALNGEILEGEHIVIGTGSRAFIPEGIVYDAKDIITSDEVLELRELPKNIAIYGAGAIGLEMAGFFAMAGVSVSLIERASEILPKAHSQIRKALQEQLEKLGVQIFCDRAIKSAKSSSNAVEIVYASGKKEHFEKLLVAVGRRANSDVVACDEIAVEKGAIVCDENFETTAAQHYAVGDCNAKLQLAHAARAEVLNVTAQILKKEPRKLVLEHIVRFIHTMPMSYAAVGKTAVRLQEEKIAYKESLIRLNQFTYSAYMHAKSGVMLTYVDREGFILGAEIFAPHAEELIAAVAMSIAGEMDVAHAQNTILAHPTFSEALERTFYKL